MPTPHDVTAQRIADKKGVVYNRGTGPDIKTPRQIIEVETKNTIPDAGRRLRGYRGAVYVAGADRQATKAALEHYENTTIGVMDASGKILKRSRRKKSSAVATRNVEVAATLGERLRRFRLARGVSLDDLEVSIGRTVSKQALSKYEHGKMQPKAAVLNRIAAALGVNSTQLWSEPMYHVKCLAYRRRARLPKKERERIECFVAELLEKRVSFQERMGQLQYLELPFKAFPVRKLDDAEDAALALRQRWNLGVSPIANLVDVLEDHHIHVIEIDEAETFDGIAAFARDDDKNVLAAAIAVRRGTWGDRHRLNMAHELGHLTLKLSEDVDTEKAAFKFGAAFLAPAEELHREFGTEQRRIQQDDLLYLKWRYGLSIQAILYRLNDLKLISDSHAKQWWINISKLGWKKREPIEIPAEKPKRFYLQVYHARSNGLIEEEEADQLLSDTLEAPLPRTLTEHRALMQLPTAMRHNLLREQAKQMADFHKTDSEGHKREASNLVEDEPT